MRKRAIPITVLLALASPLVAQTTWIVDAANGPGAHFTDLRFAIQAAAAGDRIEVRPGTYGVLDPVLTIDKSLVIHGAAWVAVPPLGLEVPRVFLSSLVLVQNLPAGGEVVLQNLALQEWLRQGQASPRGLRAQAVQGRLHLERCVFGAPCAQAAAPGLEVSFTDCARVTVHDSELWATSAPIACVRADVQVVRSLLRSASPRCDPLWPNQTAFDTLHCEDSTLALLDSTVRAADADMDPFTCQYTLPPTRPLVLLRSTVTLGAGAVVIPGQGYRFGACTVCLPGSVPFAGQGTVLLDPSVRVDCPLLAEPGVVVQQGLITSVHPGVARVGGTVTAHLRAESGAVALLLVGLPLLHPQTLPIGLAWLDPPASVFLGVVPVAGTGTAASTHAVFGGLPTGTLLLFQAAVVTPAGGVLTSLPGVVATDS